MKTYDILIVHDTFDSIQSVPGTFAPGIQTSQYGGSLDHSVRWPPGSSGGFFASAPDGGAAIGRWGLPAQSHLPARTENMTPESPRWDPVPITVAK